MLYKFVGILLASIFFAGCATTNTQTQAAVSSEPVEEIAGKEASAESEGKMSLDAALDEYDKVTLLDDDTGEEKLICRRLKPPTGTRYGSRKVCATRKQWTAEAQQAKDSVNAAQRNMDARGPN